jgi:hypothetical protein
MTSIIATWLMVVALALWTNPAAAGGEKPPPEDEYDSSQRRLRRQVAPATQAFERGDQAALRRWMSKARRPSDRTYAAVLLVKLGDTQARTEFVTAFPAGDQEEFVRVEELGAATCVSKESACLFRGQTDLICAAVAGWAGAAEKLLQLRTVTDGSAHWENCCGMARLAAHRPDQTLALFVKQHLENDLLHAFRSEGDPVDARRLLAHLKGTKYQKHRLERFRQSLLPVLESKAAQGADASKPCQFLKCPT